MNNIQYISEENLKLIVAEESESAARMGRSHIRSPEAFLNHLISVGNVAHEVAERVMASNKQLKNSPSELNPDLLRVTGYFHDFAKIGGNVFCPDQMGGGMWHDLEGAYMALTRNDELGLIIGGCAEDRGKAIKEICLGITSDYCLAEEVGSDFPRTAAYSFTSGLIERADFLRRELSSDEAPIPWERIVFPDNLARKISQYADLVNVVGEGEERVVERLEEIEKRYERWASEAESSGDLNEATYCRHQVKVASSSSFRERILSNIRSVEEFI